MQLKSLDICGFKSFPDKIQLHFDHGITAVVGPNGSGKSNIADAIRWVLGEQSGKTLRSGKMEDVIFSGTQQRKAMGYARVTLFIDNTDRTLDIDSDEVAIGRKLYRTGESEYRINGTAVRLRDVGELFMDTGLGRDGYSIIGQGRIAEIVGAKSIQRREIFEEAAGIGKYRYRREQAQKRLEQAQENLLRLRDILTELESRVEPLRIQAEKAQIYLQYAQRKRTLEISLWLREIVRLRDKLRVCEDERLVAQTDHEQLRELLEETEQRVQQIYNDIAVCNIETEKKRGEMTRLQEQSAAGTSQVAVWQNDLTHHAQTQERLRETLQIQSVGRVQLEEGLSADMREIQEKEQALQALQAGRAALQTQLRTLESLHAQSKQDQERIEKQRSAVEQKIAHERLKMATSTTIFEQLQMNQESVEQQSLHSVCALENLKKQRDDMDVLLESIRQQLETQTNMRDGFRLKCQGAEERVQACKERLEGVLTRQRDTLQKAKLLEEMEKNLEGFAQSVRYIMAQKKSGNLRGIEGDVSHLIHVQPQHVVAVETALGGAMQNIVVSTEAAAKVAIEALQKARAGRATFLPLSVIKPRTLDETGLEQCEGFVACAADLVECETQYRNMLKNLLGRIVIAQDMNSALALARRYNFRFKVVTLDGQVINPGGSMTGGSHTQGTGILSRAGEIKALRQTARLAGEDDATKQLKTAEEAFSGLSAQLGGMEANLRNMGDERIRCEGERKRFQMAWDDLEHRQEEARRQAAQTDKRLHELTMQSGSAQEAIASLGVLETQLSADVLSKHVQTQAQAEQMVQASARAMQMELDQLALEKDIEAVRRLSEQLSIQLETQVDQVEELHMQLTRLREQRMQIQEWITQAEEEISCFAQQIKSIGAQAEQLGMQKNALEQAAAQQRQQEKELHGRREILARELARQEERKLTIQKEYDGVIARLYDEYELTLTQAEALQIQIADAGAAQKELALLKSKIKNLGTINVAAIEEYTEVDTRYRFMKAQIEDVERSREQLYKMIDALTVEMKQIFLTHFEAINGHFSQIFVELFSGGNAKLLLEDPEHALESGIEIYVQPPGKIIKSLASLSGGEQAFVAIAIYFAIMKVHPSPFCLLDEIEAALDDVNVVKYAQYLRRLSDCTQFIAITHRRGTMEEADVLYGVTMQEEGISKLLRLNVSELESKLGDPSLACVGKEGENGII